MQIRLVWAPSVGTRWLAACGAEMGWEASPGIFMGEVATGRLALAGRGIPATLCADVHRPRYFRVTSAITVTAQAMGTWLDPELPGNGNNPSPHLRYFLFCREG